MVDDFVSWYNESFLQLNVSKTKDLILSFRQTPPCSELTTVKIVGIELVDNNRYLGAVLNDKLCFKSHFFGFSKDMLRFPR